MGPVKVGQGELDKMLANEANRCGFSERKTPMGLVFILFVSLLALADSSDDTSRHLFLDDSVSD